MWSIFRESDRREDEHRLLILMGESFSMLLVNVNVVGNDEGGSNEVDYSF